MVFFSEAYDQLFALHQVDFVLGRHLVALEQHAVTSHTFTTHTFLKGSRRVRRLITRSSTVPSGGGCLQPGVPHSVGQEAAALYAMLKSKLLD